MPRKKEIEEALSYLEVIFGRKLTEKERRRYIEEFSRLSEKEFAEKYQEIRKLAVEERKESARVERQRKIERKRGVREVEESGGGVSRGGRGRRGVIEDVPTQGDVIDEVIEKLESEGKVQESRVLRAFKTLSELESGKGSVKEYYLPDELYRLGRARSETLRSILPYTLDLSEDVKIPSWLDELAKIITERYREELSRKFFRSPEITGRDLYKFFRLGTGNERAELIRWVERNAPQFLDELKGIPPANVRFRLYTEELGNIVYIDLIPEVSDASLFRFKPFGKGFLGVALADYLESRPEFSGKSIYIRAGENFYVNINELDIPQRNFLSQQRQKLWVEKIRLSREGWNTPDELLKFMGSLMNDEKTLRQIQETRRLLEYHLKPVIDRAKTPEEAKMVSDVMKDVAKRVPEPFKSITTRVAENIEKVVKEVKEIPKEVSEEIPKEIQVERLPQSEVEVRPPLSPLSSPPSVHIPVEVPEFPKPFEPLKIPEVPELQVIVPTPEIPTPEVHGIPASPTPSEPVSSPQVELPTRQVQAQVQVQEPLWKRAIKSRVIRGVGLLSAITLGVLAYYHFFGRKKKEYEMIGIPPVDVGGGGDGGGRFEDDIVPAFLLARAGEARRYYSTLRNVVSALLNEYANSIRSAWLLWSSARERVPELKLEDILFIELYVAEHNLPPKTREEIYRGYFLARKKGVPISHPAQALSFSAFEDDTDQRYKVLIEMIDHYYKSRLSSLLPTMNVAFREYFQFSRAYANYMARLSLMKMKAKEVGLKKSDIEALLEGLGREVGVRSGQSVGGG